MTDMVSGSADGEIIMWNLPEKLARFQINGHAGMVRGLAFAENHPLSADTIFVSSGDDSKVCIWSLNSLKDQFNKKQLAHENV